jgi:hypothetical protein
MGLFGGGGAGGPRPVGWGVCRGFPIFWLVSTGTPWCLAFSLWYLFHIVVFISNVFLFWFLLSSVRDFPLVIRGLPIDGPLLLPLLLGWFPNNTELPSYHITSSIWPEVVRVCAWILQRLISTSLLLSKALFSVRECVTRRVEESPNLINKTLW